MLFEGPLEFIGDPLRMIGGHLAYFFKFGGIVGDIIRSTIGGPFFLGGEDAINFRCQWRC